jgi:hypothetical protein
VTDIVLILSGTKTDPAASMSQSKGVLPNHLENILRCFQWTFRLWDLCASIKRCLGNANVVALVPLPTMQRAMQCPAKRTAAVFCFENVDGSVVVLVALAPWRSGRAYGWPSNAILENGQTALHFAACSTPTEIQSMSENDFECFASTGVNAPGRYFLILADAEAKYL